MNTVNDKLSIFRQYDIIGGKYVDYKCNPVASIAELQTSEKFEGLVKTVMSDASGATREYVCVADSGGTLTWKPLYLTIDEATALGGLKVEVVDKLPSTGKEGILYLVRVSGKTYCNEYIWVKSENRFEQIGSTEIDLSNYYKKSETDELLAQKQNTLVSGTNIKTINGKTILIASSGDTKDIQITTAQPFLSGFTTTGTFYEFCRSIVEAKVPFGMAYVGGITCVNSTIVSHDKWPDGLTQCECLVQVIENKNDEYELYVECYSTNKAPYVWSRIYWAGNEGQQSAMEEWLPYDSYNRVQKTSEANKIYGTNASGEQTLYNKSELAYDDTIIKAAISANTTSINVNASAISANTATINSHTTSINSNTALINELSGSLESNYYTKSSIDNDNRIIVKALNQEKSGRTASDSALQASISALSGSLETNYYTKSSIDDKEYVTAKYLNDICFGLKQYLYLKDTSCPKFDIHSNMKWDSTQSKWIVDGENWLNYKTYYDEDKSVFAHITYEILHGNVIFKMPVAANCQFKLLLCQDWDWTDGVDDHGFKCPTWYHESVVMNMEYGYSTEWIKEGTAIYRYGDTGNMTVANDGFIFIMWKHGGIDDPESFSKNAEEHVYPKILIAFNQTDVNPFTE